MKKFLAAIGQALFWVTYPAIYLILNNSHRSRVIIGAGDKVLFVRGFISGDKKLKLPGGGIRSSEESQKAAIREVSEEAGIDLSFDELRIVVTDLAVKENGINYRIDCYAVRLPEPIVSSPRHIEIIETKWLSVPKYLDSEQLSDITNQLLKAWLSKQHLVD